MREREIEKYLRVKVRAIGGKAYKWVSPGNNGVPDRIVCLPDGRIEFVETKSEGSKPTELQAAQHNKLRALGFRVTVIDSKTGVDRFVSDITPRAIDNGLPNTTGEK